MDDFWKRVYDVLMTPLPPPKKLELDRLFEVLRKAKPGEIPTLPTAPEWVQQYARERGLHPDQQPVQQQPSLMGLRNMLINQDPYHPDTRIPNLYRGELQPDFERGNSLPEVFDRTRGVRT